MRRMRSWQRNAVAKFAILCMPMLMYNTQRGSIRNPLGQPLCWCTCLQAKAASDAQLHQDAQEAAARERELNAQATHLHGSLQASEQREASLESRLQELSSAIEVLNQQHAALQQRHSDAAAAAVQLQDDLHILQLSSRKRIEQLEHDEEAAAGHWRAAETEWNISRDRLTNEALTAEAHVRGGPPKLQKPSYVAHATGCGMQAHASRVYSQGCTMVQYLLVSLCHACAHA